MAAVLPTPPGVYDEGLIVSGAGRILHGQLPYVDFNSGYPPAQFYTIALVFRIFGSNLLAERIWDALWRLALVGAAVWLAREVAGRSFRLLPLACCAALAGASGFRLYPMVVATLPCLCALSCALAFDRTRNLNWIFGAGLLLGCTAVYRHDLGAFAGVVVLGCVWRNGRAIGRLVVGTLVVVGPVAAYLVAVIPRRFLWESFVAFPGVNVAARHLPLAGSPLELIGNVVLPAAILLLAAVDAWRAPAGRRKPAIAVAAMGAMTLTLATQRLDAIHAFPALVFCTVMLAGFGRLTLPRGALMLSALFFYGMLASLEWNAGLRFIRLAPASGIARAGPVRIGVDEAEAVRYVEDHTAPGEKLYVGTTTHSRIFINDALFAFLADRPQATRYDMWLPGETNGARVQSEIVSALETGAVRYVVLFDAPRSNEPNLSSEDSGVRTVDDYLGRRYREVAVFGRYRILQRIA
jgi:hypothetical protein